MANTTRRNSSDRDRRDSGVRSSYAARTASDTGKKTQDKNTNNHAGQKRSGLNRDQYDSAVRSSYSGRAAADSAKARANNQVSEQEFNRSSSMQRSYGNYQNYQQGRKVTAGGFYSKPTPSQETTAAMQLTKTVSEAIGENRKKNYLVELAKKIGYKPEWTADAAQRNQTEYEDLYARYQEARAKSEPLYEAFLKDEEQWRQTIRGKDEVAADVERLNQMKSALEDRQKQLKGMAGQMLVASRQTAGSFAQAKQMQAEAEAIGKQIDEVKEQLALVGEEQGWEFYYRYEKYKADPEFALKSKYTSEPTGESIPTTEEQMMAGNPKTPKLWKSISYEMINGNQDAIGIIRSVLDYDYTGDELGEHLRGYEDGRQVALGMTDEERATFNYLYHARGAQAAAEYFYELEAVALNTRFREKKEEEARAFAQEYPVAANVYSVVWSNLTKPVTFLNQVLDYADDGKLVKDAPYNKHSYIQSAIRDETSKNWHPVGQFAYQTGMSLADFAYTAMITGGLSKSGTAASKEFAKNMSLAIMGTGAAADTTLAAKDRGLSDGKALTLGTVAGMAEILTEKFSIDTLLEGLGSNKGIAYLAKNMAAEGSEEVASDLINLVADVVVARDESEWHKAIEAGMAQGLTEQEAFSRAFAAEAINIGLSGLGGVISGGVMGGGYMAYSKGVENKYYNEGMKMIGHGLVAEEGRAELMEAVQAGLQLEKDSPAYKQAKAINDKIEKGKKISALEAGRMYTAVSAAEEAQLREQAEKGTEKGTQNARPSDPGVENGTENARPAETVTAGTPTKVSSDYVAVKHTPREVTQGMTEQEATGARMGVRPETVKRVGDVSRLLGVNVVWYREGPENGQIKDGYYNRETGKIHLNADTPNPTMQIISHELTHALEGTRSYGDFYRLILGEMTDLDTQVQDKIAAYAGAGITLNSDGAKKEIVAHYVQTTLLTDEKAIRRIVRKNTGFGRWMMNSIDKLLAKLGNTHAKERLKLRRASDLYAKALREFQKEAKYLEANDGRLVLQKAEYTAEDAERARRDLDEAFERGEITEEELATAMDEIDSALEESEGHAAALADRNKNPHSVSEDGSLKLPKVENTDRIKDSIQYNVSETQKRLADAKVPTYEELISKPDIPVIDIRGNGVESFKEQRSRLRDEAEMMGMYNAPVENIDTGAYIFTDKKTLAHIFSNLGKEQLGLVLKLPAIIKNSVLTHREETRKSPYDQSTGIYTLFGAVMTKKGVAPVKLKVKEYYIRGQSVPKWIAEWIKNKPWVGTYARTYDGRIMVLDGIEKEGASSSVASTKQISLTADNYPSAPSSISIEELLSLVKGDAQKYLPKKEARQDEEMRRMPRSGRSYSVSEETDGKLHLSVVRPEEAVPHYMKDMAEEEAASRGYPVINGVQVVPLKTYVHAADRGNYGLVVGMGIGKLGEPALKVFFRNKHNLDVPEAVVDLPVDILTPVPGIYQMTEEEYESLRNSFEADREGMREQYKQDQAEMIREAEEIAKADAALINRQVDKIMNEIEAGERTDMREGLPRRVKDELAKVERYMEQSLRAALNEPKFAGAGRGYMRNVVREIIGEYLNAGAVSSETVDRLFWQTYEKGIMQDASYYNEYKFVKDYLRATKVTISEQDKADIPDYGIWRKKAFGLLRIVNEGGLAVDSAYDDLRGMAPELFPIEITHPADQLQHMFETAKSITVAEKNLDEYYGPEAETFRKWARAAFDNTIWENVPKLRHMREYADERKAVIEFAESRTTEQLLQDYEDLKKAKREYDRALQRNHITPTEEKMVNRLIRGEVLPETIDAVCKRPGEVREVYEAKRRVETISKRISKSQHGLRAKKDAVAEQVITEENIQFMKDKKTGLQYARETMQRNNEDVMPPEVARKVNALFFDTIRKSEKKANEFKSAARERVKKMKLSRDVAKGNLVSEAHAVQLYGEALANIEILENMRGQTQKREGKTLQEWKDIETKLWLENPNLDRGKIEQAVKDFRVIYDKLLELMNRVRVQNGYEPVSYRKGYFPHFQPGGDGIMAQFAAAMGITMDVTALPTTINGLTYTFNPGITWFGNTMERLGFSTAYDAVEGFDKYIEGVSNVIFFTENIQMLRALERRIRYLCSDEGVQKQVDEIRKSDRNEKEKETLVEEALKKGQYRLSNYTNNLHEYTNLLAGKKSELDRGVESMIGRRWYNLAKAWEKRIGANMVGANFGSALTNFIPLQQAGAQLPAGTIMKAMLETMKNMKDSDGIAERSAFIANRKGSDPIVKTWVEKASGIAGIPMEYIDSFVAETIVRAKYGQNIKAGLSEEAAMDDADAWAARIMAERSKGGMPTLFASTNPVVKLFAQFQLEVNNEFSLIFKDIPRANREKGLKALAAVLLRYIFGAWVFNEFYEFFVGRRPALDPLNIINETVGDFSGYEIPNLVRMGVDLLRGEKPDFTTKKETAWGAAGNLLTNAAGELPFSSALALLGADVDGGRIPAASGVPSIPAIAEALGSDADPKKKWDTAKKELNKLAYVLPPFGGGQLSKMVKGIKALAQGGSYSVNRDGEDLLQYPVYKDSVGDKIMSAGQMLLFGKSATREAQEWVDSGFQSLSAKETAVYQDLTENGMKDRDAFAFIKSLQGQEEKRQAIIDSDVSEETKVIAFYGLMASKEERAFLDDLDQRGFDGVACAGAMLDASVAETKEEKLEAMAGRDLEPAAYVEIADKVGILSSDKQRETMDSLAEQGQDMEQCAELLVEIVAAEKRADKLALIRDIDIDREGFDEFAAFICGSKELTTEAGNRTQYAKLMDVLDAGLDRSTAVQMQIDGHDLNKVLELTDAGMKPATAAQIVRNVGELEPEDGYDDVQAAQKWRACVDATSDPDDQVEALRVIMRETEFAKLEMAYNTYEIQPEAFVRLKERLPEFDEDGNGSFKQSEVTAAMTVLFPVNVLPGGGSLSNEQKAALWQLWTGSKSAKNNPYSRSVGQQVIDARNAAKEAEEAEEEEEKDYRLRLPR